MVTTDADGRRIFWNGHLCEGRLVPGTDRVLLWTRCRRLDVPRDQAMIMEPDDEITCPDCARLTLN
jgi:hypothetical protein